MLVLLVPSADWVLVLVVLLPVWIPVFMVVLLVGAVTFVLLTGDFAVVVEDPCTTATVCPFSIVSRSVAVFVLSAIQ